MSQENAENEREKPARGRASRKRRLPRGRVTVFPNWCKGCNLCVEFCPMEVLEQGQDGRVIVARPERCTACRWCELHCPDFAVFVSDIEEGKKGEDDADPDDPDRGRVAEEEAL